MKKIVAAIAVLLCAGQVLFAVPARPGKITKTQPDGSTIVIQLHGDEWSHWMTNEAGQLLEKGEDGFYHPSSKSLEEYVQAGRINRMMHVQQTDPEALKASGLATGTRNILVLLVDFSDTKFTIASTNAAVKSAFENMLNQEGYSDNGGTGSVRDFYVDNSHGAYTPVFDVYGPITLSKKASSYASTSGAQSALKEACSSLSSVSLSKYDSDNDGYVDAVLMYYAGYDAAQGGENTIWSHRSSISSTTQYGAQGGKKKIRDYFCTSEKRGSSGDVMCGIGTTCHEFAHFLGLPDMYDTDYEVNGYAGGAYSYSVMCSGPYLNDCCTPPYFGIEERMMLGWIKASSVTEISSPGSYTLANVDNNVAYRIATSTTNEYFLLESRGYGAWDRYLPSPGLVVYHVDKSSRTITVKNRYGYDTNASASSLWSSWESYNAINENGSHPCYSVVSAPNPSSLYYTGGEGSIPFPGMAGISQFSPEDWNGNPSVLFLSDIAYNGVTGVTSIKVKSNEKAMYGRVLDATGNAIEGATVRVLSSSGSSSKSRIIAHPFSTKEMKKLNGSPFELTATTDENGEYYLDLAEETDATFEVAVSAGEYVTEVYSVTVESEAFRQNFRLFSFEDATGTSLRKYYADENTSLYYSTFADYESMLPSSTDFSMMGAVGFTADELRPYVGRKVEKIQFFYVSETVKEVHALLDFGSSRKVWAKASDPVSADWTTVDISDKNIVIPEKTDIYAGYALNQPKLFYPLIVEYDNPRDGGYYISQYNTDSATWCAHDGNLIVRLVLSEPETMQTMGYNTIDNPQVGYYEAGATFALKLNETDQRAVASVEWYFDDEPVSGDSVVLSAGEHVVEARMVLANGKRKIVEQVLIVE